MTFNDMVKSIRNKENRIEKTVFKQYSMLAEDYVSRDIENGDMSIVSTPTDAILDYTRIYDEDTGEVNSVYLTPGFDEANFTEIKLMNGDIINSLNLGRKKRVNLDEIKGIIMWNDGFLTIYGDVVLSVDEDDLAEQVFGEDRANEEDVNVIYLPHFY